MDSKTFLHPWWVESRVLARILHPGRVQKTLLLKIRIPGINGFPTIYYTCIFTKNIFGPIIGSTEGFGSWKGSENSCIWKLGFLGLRAFQWRMTLAFLWLWKKLPTGGAHGFKRFCFPHFENPKSRFLDNGRTTSIVRPSRNTRFGQTAPCMYIDTLHFWSSFGFVGVLWLLQRYFGLNFTSLCEFCMRNRYRNRRKLCVIISGKFFHGRPFELKF